MSKIKLFTGLFICLFAYLIIGLFSPVKAATVVQIQQLPSTINYTDFKLSCTTDGSSAQFYSRKDGSGYSAFGPSINLSTNPCQVNVDGNQFGSDGKFWFEVIVDGDASETSTTLDRTAPDGVSDFGKDRIGGGTVYHLHWKNPNNSDYQRVFIYRSTEAGFEADANHKIAEAGGAPDVNMTWDDGGLDPTKDYFYYIRALDKAGNSSGLVGDIGTTTITATPKPGTTGGAVTQLPTQSGTGSVLGTEASPTPEATAANQGGLVDQINQYASQTPGPLKWILTHKKISLGILVIIGLLAYNFYTYSKRNK